MILEPQAAVDDSGSEPQSPIFVLGGFIASATQWAAFAAEWQAALDEPPGLAYFKLTEAMSLSSKGEFSRKKGWSEHKRDARVVELSKIIRKHASARIHTSISNEDFVRYVQSLPVPRRQSGADHPYLLLASQLLLTIGFLGDRLGLTSPCKFFFDEQAGFSDDLSAWWSSFNASLNQFDRPNLKRFVASEAPTYANKRRFPPLQAADFYSGYLRRHAISNRRLAMRPPSALQELEVIPSVGYNVGIQLVRDIRAALISSAEKFAAANTDLTVARIDRNQN